MLLASCHELQHTHTHTHAKTNICIKNTVKKTFAVSYKTDYISNKGKYKSNIITVGVVKCILGLI